MRLVYGPSCATGCKILVKGFEPWHARVWGHWTEIQGLSPILMARVLLVSSCKTIPYRTHLTELRLVLFTLSQGVQYSQPDDVPVPGPLNGSSRPWRVGGTKDITHPATPILSYPMAARVPSEEPQPVCCSRATSPHHIAAEGVLYRSKVYPPPQSRCM